jgi:hypothetical protein
MRQTLLLTCFFLIGCNSADIREELDEVKAELARLKTDQAYLRPGDAGYATIKYDLGTLTVELSDIKPYANGSKVRLRFGNLLASNVNGLKTTLEWGHVDENGYAIKESIKSKEFSFLETLSAGSWTTISVILDGVPPSDLGFVTIKKVSHTGISLK